MQKKKNQEGGQHFFTPLYMCVYIYIYIINIHSTHTYFMYTKTFILDAINHCPALVLIFI